MRVPIAPSPITPALRRVAARYQPNHRPTHRAVATSPPRRRRVKTAYVALGSNVGDRVAMIERACDEMARHGIRVTRTSGLWETTPMYVLDQPRFVNGACEIETELEPLALLDELQAIEKIMGRQKSVDKGPRNIDLDIMLYDDQDIHHDRLTVPHAGLLERDFMLRPLAELVPGKYIGSSHPRKTTQDFLDGLGFQGPSPPVRFVPLSPAAAPLTPSQQGRGTRLMAILNVTPDSFSDGGTHMTPEAVGRAVLAFVRAGAAVIDVGGQSTRPGAPPVSAEEETARVVSAIRTIRSLPEPEAARIPVSVDTYRASVAEAACAAGADVINDVSAGVLDPEMLPVAARLGKTLVLMHMRGDPTTMAGLREYPHGLVAGVAAELRARVAAAESAGVRRWRLVIDPGLGFAKAGAQNLVLLRRLAELRGSDGLWGLPWLVGPSRKSFIGAVTGEKEPAERVWGTAAAVAAAVAGGADVVRVHDVSEMARVVRMADAIWREGGEAEE